MDHTIRLAAANPLEVIPCVTLFVFMALNHNFLVMGSLNPCLASQVAYQKVTNDLHMEEKGLDIQYPDIHWLNLKHRTLVVAPSG